MTKRLLAYLGVMAALLWWEQRAAAKQAEKELERKKERFLRAAWRG